MGSQGGAVQEAQSGGSGSLARQGSLYNLTLDEVQNQLGNLGKPLGSMNLDELLKSVFTAEAGGCGGGGGGGQASSGLGSGTDANIQQQHAQLASVSSLNRQGSLTVSGDLSKKTIDEVWRDMQRKKSGGNSNNNDKKTKETPPTFGEMTLEDFLVKAGVVAESFATEDNAMSRVDSNVASQHNVSDQVHWIQYQIPSVQPAPHLQHNQHQKQQNNMIAGYIAGPMSPSSLMGTLSDTQTPGRKRVASGTVVEKTVERRQKRMIKNRESAARSRARKQAYTQELENKVSRLEEENERLKRQQEIEKVLPSEPPPEPKRQLRRTSSGPL
ncbi:ABSCISIC ACID-INSENSITIVE 5-like protein 2 [Arachis duranensis]|uniref:ABSCISIC ACID-INSENSITIVE 5-like protein 2 n=1 Tax=Arachis duranensis TaxID=130453 RepID=A0A6P4DQP7_ARADU|nr:ABSCISIC ACID-INSENSITIVE 5-like protein 2 [Arachis duranensis]